MTAVPAAPGAGQCPSVRADAVTFDFWDTLMATKRGDIHAARLEAWREVAGDAERLDEALTRFEQAFREARVLRPAGSTIELAYETLETVADLLPPVPRTALAHAFAGAPERLPTVFAPGLAPTLAALRAAGLRLGIVSNVATTTGAVMRAYLRDVGWLDHFAALTFSDEVGVCKPERRIFELTLVELGAAPGRVVHVGDSRIFDVAGARAAGMVPVRYAGIRDDLEPEEVEAEHVIHRLPDLLGLVGLATPQLADAAAR